MSEPEKNPEQGGAQPESTHGGRPCCGRGQHRRCCGRRPWWAKLIVVAVIIGAVFAWHAWGHDRFCGFGHGLSQASHDRDMGPSRMREHAERITGRMLDRVNADVAQRQKVLVIARAAADDLQPLIEAHRATRASFYTALTAEPVEAARLKQLRSETLQRADAVSRRLTQEIADMAAVFSPEQRRKLLARWAPQLGA